MFDIKNCSWFEIEYADYDFDFYDKKEIVSKILKNQKPKSVKEFNSKGTEWDLWGETDDSFTLFIEGAKLETSTISCNFIQDLLSFLLRLAYSNDTTLICPFECEGSADIFIVVPMENNCIRVSVFNSGIMPEYSLKENFRADIVINKNTFLKQMRDILQLAANYDKEPRNIHCDWINKIKYTISELDKCFENPDEFKQNYKPKRYIRVFDVGYKTLDNKWKFEMCLEEDDKANVVYWQKLKSEGKILDYDFFEQYSEDLFFWDKIQKCPVERSIKDIRKNLKNDMGQRASRNWVYSDDTKKWYSENEIMPAPKEKNYVVIYTRLKYRVLVVNEIHPYLEDSALKSYIEDSYDNCGNLKEDSLGYLKCCFELSDNTTKICEIDFDYRNNKEIRNGLKKAQNGEYARFNLGSYKHYKMHLWQQFYQNTESSEAEYLTIACYDINRKELNLFVADKNKFIECFNNALDEIENKINVTKYVLEAGKKLKIKDKFYIEKSKHSCEKLEYVENFVGEYACVYKGSLDGAGIINKNFEWVIKPEYVTITDKTHPKWGVQIKGFKKRFRWLHNINGKLFIATKDDNKKFVMDINGDIQIPHVSDEIYYTTLNNELYFLAIDYDKTFITDSKGKDVLILDFSIGEKFWLFDEIIILSKNGKYGIIDWKDNIIFDFIFSEISPDKDNLDFIPAKYIDMWGYIDKKGKIFDLKKIKDRNKTSIKR